MKKSRRNDFRKTTLFAWLYILWCDLIALRWYDMSWRAMGLRFLGIGLASMLGGVFFLVGGVVTLQPRALIFGAIVLGFGLFAFLIGLMYRSSE